MRKLFASLAASLAVGVAALGYAGATLAQDAASAPALSLIHI